MKEKKYLIYMHTNKFNNKKYIGQTCEDPERRWRKDGKGYRECPLFWKAIQAYGWDNFDHEIIEENLSVEEAEEREIYWIAYYDTFDNPDKGYNLTPGGGNYMQQLWGMPEYREKMCQAFREARKKSWENPDFREKALNNLISGVKRVWADPEWRKKRIEAITGDKNPNAKCVINIDTGKRFTTISEAAKWAGLNCISGIGECCKGKQKSSGFHPTLGYRLHWCFEGEEDKIDFKALEEERGKHKNTINVKCLENNRIFKDANEAGRWAGLKNGDSVRKCCLNKQKTTGINPDTGERCTWQYISEEVRDN